MWFAAKVAGEVMERIRQTRGSRRTPGRNDHRPRCPRVVHESEVLHALAELGVVILLFEVGLESDLGDLLRADLQATLVAIESPGAPCRWAVD